MITGENLGVLVVICLALIAIFIGLSLYYILRNPFEYLYYTITFDVSKKRQPNYLVLLNNFINTNGIEVFSRHYKQVQEWKLNCEKDIENSKLKKYREMLYFSVIDDEHMFNFELIRKQTRYQQVNYNKIPYTINIIISIHSHNIKFIQQRFEELSKITYECTLSEYTSSNQRKKMNKSLRDTIKKRDNYTCQMCGKYMPDEVGLQIDHIIPIKKGGKIVPSNLQVLCSICNGKKSSKKIYKYCLLCFS